MKIYTKSGDDGSTGLIGGQRVPKSDPRIECYGTIDEMNAAIGLAAVEADPSLLEMLRAVQNELFVIGAALATPQTGAPRDVSIPHLEESSIARLEQQIDATDLVLPPLQNFILPGGSELAARLHLVRTICRRAERLLVAMALQQAVDPLIVKYVNRLSDWLFVQARLVNHLAGVADVPWHSAH